MERPRDGRRQVRAKATMAGRHNLISRNRGDARGAAMIRRGRAQRCGARGWEGRTLGSTTAPNTGCQERALNRTAPGTKIQRAVDLVLIHEGQGACRVGRRCWRTRAAAPAMATKESLTAAVEEQGNESASPQLRPSSEPSSGPAVPRLRPALLPARRRRPCSVALTSARSLSPTLAL